MFWSYDVTYRKQTHGHRKKFKTPLIIHSRVLKRAKNISKYALTFNWYALFSFAEFNNDVERSHCRLSGGSFSYRKKIQFAVVSVARQNIIAGSRIIGRLGLGRSHSGIGWWNGGMGARSGRCTMRARVIARQDTRRGARPPTERSARECTRLYEKDVGVLYEH